ncbi:probable RNA-binding protein EIF1AD [Zeugodacus cucurbitae]|uniref:probable RNA-binding protein EIF1AD n=1 Tax=Zeugodacus cucurbitae TaxID=28588 RepID=UPI000596A647|nr:probable RNA-binding protein EIF1AD [Zeugodacus cucurbitae]
MSRVVRRKHVLKEMMEDDFDLPTEQQQIVRVVSSRGNNLHEVETSEANAENFLASMPNKFRKNVWVKRGDYVLVEPIEEGDKVKAEICKILTPEHIKEYTKAGVWPKAFGKKREHEQVEANSDEEESDGDDLLMKNPNRPAQTQEESDSDSDADDDDGEENSSDED